MSNHFRRRVRFSAPGSVEVLEEPLPDPDPAEVRVQTQLSAISPGTERLVYEGTVPEDLAADTSISALQDDDFTYPLSYGYATVGVVQAIGREVSDDWEGRRVFSFQPHVSHYVAAPAELIPLPEEVEFSDAALIPSLETAVNLVMDGRPMIGERVVVFGQGVVGLLTTRLLADHPLDTLIAVEPSAQRRRLAASLGADAYASASEASIDSPDAASRNDVPSSGRADLIFELTGRPSVLNDAVPMARFSGRVVVGSWYGTKTAPIALGRRFHRSRTRIVSSQVSTIDPSLQGRWTKDRRMAVVLDLLPDINPGQLISHRFSVEEAPSAYERLVEDPSVLQPVFAYDSLDRS